MVNFVSEFSLEEENELLQYIIKNNSYQFLQKEQFWKEVESSEITKRTWQHLKRHFENKLVHKLKNPYFKLNREEIGRLLKASSCTDQENNLFDKDNEEQQTKVINKGNPKKIIVITRRKSNTNVYPNYRTEGNKRILVSRHSNPSPDMSYPQPNPGNPRRTILASLCTGKKKEVFVVRPKYEEPFELYGSPSNTSNGKQLENKPPKKLICFCHNVT